MTAPMRDDESLVITDDEVIEPVPAPPAVPGDPEAPERDALEQSAEVAPGWRVGRPSPAFDAPEGDAVDQATEVPAEADGQDRA